MKTPCVFLGRHYKRHTEASIVAKYVNSHYADLAHLVERHLAKVEVAGSSPVIRSNKKQEITAMQVISCFIIRRHSQAVRQRSAKPSPPVRFWVAPPERENAPKRVRFFVLEASLLHEEMAFDSGRASEKLPVAGFREARHGASRLFGARLCFANKKTMSSVSRRLQKIKQPNRVALFFIQADEGGLVCNQRAPRVVCNCDGVAYGITPGRACFVGLITYIPSG